MSDNNELHVHWNDSKILEAAGRNPETVFTLLDRHGQTHADADGIAQPTPDAVYQWVSRRKIPDHWRPRIVYVLLAEQRLQMSQLFRVGSEAKKQKTYPRKKKGTLNA